ncbi:hypothetical protein H5410_032437 [Solanum commersonii]|uniref:Retrotransposon gag domain-containing protein n=1 Tax=Solanum commersonii TaxID=4109 RepID=A0A9J5YJY1_SOLCO|nr:hypothetical protein H5410_032437 [Solanum commersonii]
MATNFMNMFGFNVENAPDWFYIQNLKKKPSETFRDYAIRWRSEAARARPPMEESQMKDYFIRAQEPQYYDRMMLAANEKGESSSNREQPGDKHLQLWLAIPGRTTSSKTSDQREQLPARRTTSDHR